MKRREIRYVSGVVKTSVISPRIPRSRAVAILCLRWGAPLVACALTVYGCTMLPSVLLASVLSPVLTLCAYIMVSWLWCVYMEYLNLAVSVPTHSVAGYVISTARRFEHDITDDDVEMIHKLLWSTHIKGSLVPLTPGIESKVCDIISRGAKESQHQATMIYRTIIDTAEGTDTVVLPIIGSR